MQVNTYLKLIAGSLPAHGQGPIDDSLRMLAQEALGTSQIHYIRTPQPVNGHYHYFALPSQVVSSELNPVTPLAMALPGHPAHLGPGTYVMELGLYTLVAQFDGDQLDVICNEAELVKDYLAGQTLPEYKVPADGLAWRFESGFTRRNKTVEALTATLTKFSLLLLLVSGMAYAGLTFAEGWLTAKTAANEEITAQSLTSALKDLKVGSPLAKQLAQYQQRSSVVVRAGGWIDEYAIRGGQEHMRLFVPSWISRDYMDALGAGVTADRDIDEQLLVLVKGKPTGGNTVTSEMSSVREAKDKSAPAGR